MRSLSVVLIVIAVWLMLTLAVIALRSVTRRAADAPDEQLPDALPDALLVRLLDVAFTGDAGLGRRAAAVAYWAHWLAVAAELPPREREIVHTAGLLQTIDEPAFATAIAAGRGDMDLDPALRTLVERHATLGAHILREHPGLDAVADAVEGCHEHVDGSGCPRGRCGAEIPYTARVLAVALTHVSLTAADRHAAITPTQAADELRRRAGRQLDPALVDLFLRGAPDAAKAPAARFGPSAGHELQALRRHGIFHSSS